MKTFMESKGKKVFVVGGQAHNSSSYGASVDEACAAVRAVGGNTVEIPVYWENIEPKEGQFSFDDVEQIYHKVRENGLYLIVLWFGTWKNGTCKYAPSWVKLDGRRFHRVVAENGAKIPVLSPHCRETMEADGKAFQKLMERLAILDPEGETILAVQAENEPGIMNGPARDYGSRATEAFTCPLPEKMLGMLVAFPDSQVAGCWEANGRKTQSWSEAFGRHAEEIFTAYAVAGYVNEVARRGRTCYQTTVYTNVWVDNHRLKIPGKDYPSGGAVSLVMDVWKYVADALDFISPDNYQQTNQGYMACCDCYSRNDNPLFIPESGLLEWNSRFMFSAVADYRAIGICAFGIESILNDGEIGAQEQAVAESLQILGALAPGLVRYHDKPMTAVMQEEYAQYQYLELGHYVGIAYFTNCNSLVGRMGTDWNWHNYQHKDYLKRQQRGGCRGRGIIIQSDENEFLIAGDGFQLNLLPADGETPVNYLAGSDFHLTRSLDFISIEEGVFNEDGEFEVHRRRNGDEADFGIWVEPDVKVVRVRLCGWNEENRHEDI